MNFLDTGKAESPDFGDDTFNCVSETGTTIIHRHAITTHVDGLKQHISAQIKVSKGNNGYGILEVLNAS